MTVLFRGSEFPSNTGPMSRAGMIRHLPRPMTQYRVLCQLKMLGGSPIYQVEKCWGQWRRQMARGFQVLLPPPGTLHRKTGSITWASGTMSSVQLGGSMEGEDRLLFPALPKNPKETKFLCIPFYISRSPCYITSIFFWLAALILSCTFQIHQGGWG